MQIHGAHPLVPQMVFLPRRVTEQPTGLESPLSPPGRGRAGAETGRAKNTQEKGLKEELDI